MACNQFYVEHLDAPVASVQLGNGLVYKLGSELLTLIIFVFWPLSAGKKMCKIRKLVN